MLRLVQDWHQDFHCLAEDGLAQGLQATLGLEQALPFGQGSELGAPCLLSQDLRRGFGQEPREDPKSVRRPSPPRCSQWSGAAAQDWVLKEEAAYAALAGGAEGCHRTS
mmetsp:Transcript_42735/g.87913  ORF Transcript_42735/g.87913 Transcript_42735/m.87913 type:complete len:109 (+) Transcript_42735:393-719(+)